MLNSRKIKDELNIFSGILTSHMYLSVFAVIVLLQARPAASGTPVPSVCFLECRRAPLPARCHGVTQLPCFIPPQPRERRASADARSGKAVMVSHHAVLHAMGA
jgi:hypothetical protein